MPHPRLRERAFALGPLLDVMPDESPARSELARAMDALDAETSARHVGV